MDRASQNAVSPAAGAAAAKYRENPPCPEVSYMTFAHRKRMEGSL